MKIVKADLGEDGVVRLVARDERLEVETTTFACTDGDRWMFQHRRGQAALIASGKMPGPAVGPRIKHNEWELASDA